MNDETDNGASLRHDVNCILLECHRDRSLPALWRDGVDSKALKTFGEMLARKLGARIGGRYVPKRDERARRNEAVWAAHAAGASNARIMKDFELSHRLVYSILAQKRRG